MKSPKVEKYFEKTLVILTTLSFCFFMLEISLRCLGRVPTNMTEGIFEQYGNSYRLKKNIKKTINLPSFKYIVYTNSYNCRDKSIGIKNIDDKTYFVFLGASEVFANGVNYEDSFVGIFSEFAEKQYDIQVLNFAVGGHRFLDQVKIFKDFVYAQSNNPQKLFFSLNALTIPLFDEKYTNIFVKNGYLFNKESWTMAYIRLMLGNMSSAFCFFRDKFRILQQEWNIFDAQKKLPEHLEPFSKRTRMFNPEIVQQFKNYLQNFENYCQKNNIEIIYVYLPLIDSFRLNEIIGQVGGNPNDYFATYYEKLMESYCIERKKQLINLGPVLKTHYDKGEELRFKLDSHYTQFANQIVGEYLINTIFSRL